MSGHPEDKEVAFEWVILRNRNFFFVINFHELELEKSVQLVATDRCFTHL